ALQFAQLTLLALALDAPRLRCRLGGLALAAEQLAFPAQGSQLGLLAGALLLLIAQIVEGTVELGAQPLLSQARLAQPFLQQQSLGGLRSQPTLLAPEQQRQRHGAQQKAEQQV